MTTPVIEVKNLSKTFQRGEEAIHALRDVSLKIEERQFVSITGPSGSGKSTFLYILGLLDRQNGGDYLLDGASTSGLTDDERSHLRNQKFGFIFQSFHLLPSATALRNVAMPLVYSANYERGFTTEKIEHMATEALRRVGLEQRMLHKPNELSGGQRQRVAIARALVNSPRVIFADEPTGNLDSKTGKEVLSLFKELHADGVTVVLVTHDQEIADQAERQLRFADGTFIS